MSISSFINNPQYLRTQTITNATAGAIAIPAVAAGAVVASLPLVQTAGAVEQVMVLGEGFWAVSANASLDPIDGAQAVEFMQAQILDSVSGGIYGSSTSLFGCNTTNSANVVLNLNVDTFIRVLAGATASVVYRLRYNGVVALNTIQIVGANNPSIRAVKLDD